MPLRRDVVCPAYLPRILRRPVFLQFFQEFAEAGVEQALGAVPVEMQGQISRPGHALVYAGWPPMANSAAHAAKWKTGTRRCPVSKRPKLCLVSYRLWPVGTVRTHPGLVQRNSGRHAYHCNRDE